MATVSIADLRCIMPNTNLTDAQLQCVIDDALCWVESLPTSISDSCGECVADRVAKYLAAHLASVGGDRQQIETQTLDARDKYSDSFKAGLDASTYGQQAKRMDCTNQLSNEDIKAEMLVPKLRFTTIGVDPSKNKYPSCGGW